MTLTDFIGWIRQEHPCCVVTSATERRCTLRLTNFGTHPLAIINGTHYQKNHLASGKLADRIIFSGREGGLVCVAELKSGSWKARDTIEKVRKGFDLAGRLLVSMNVQINLSVPLVLSPRRIDPGDRRLVENNPIGLPESRRRLVHSHCGTDLAEIIPRA